MPVAPVVRYMIVCEDWSQESKSKRISIRGLITNIRAKDDPPFPTGFGPICVFLTLTDVYRQGRGHIQCVSDETGTVVFRTGTRVIESAAGPLAVVGVPFRVHHCTFDEAGMYLVQFWYDGIMVEERPILLR
jgi:hypothetical protein